MDDVIYTSKDGDMIHEFQFYIIKKEFDMTDLGLMKYYLGIKAEQQDTKIFIS